MDLLNDLDKGTLPKDKVNAAELIDMGGEKLHNNFLYVR